MTRYAEDWSFTEQVTDTTSMTMSSPSVQTPTLPAHVAHGKKLYRSGMFSDCTIHCRGRSWNLHRSMLVPRCDFFRACFASSFEESKPRAQLHGIEPSPHDHEIAVSMQDDHPDALDRMLYWIYTFSYPTLHNREPVHNPPEDAITTASGTCLAADFWTAELELCIIADKYGQRPLFEDAALSICETARACLSDSFAKEHCSCFLTHLDDFVQMLETLFAGVDSAEPFLDLQIELLEVMSDMIAKYIGQEKRLSELLTAVPTFGVMLVQVLGGSNMPCSGAEGSKSIGSGSTTAGGVHNVTKSKERESSASESERSYSTSSSSSPASETSLKTRRVAKSDSKKAGARERMVKPVPKVHIPMNEDSDLD